MAKNWEIFRFRWELISEGNLGTISLISLVYSLLVSHRCPQWYRIMRSCSSVFLLPLEVLRNLLRLPFCCQKHKITLRNIKGAAQFTGTFPDWWNLSNVFLMFYSSRYEPKFLHHFTSLKLPNLSWPSSMWLFVTREFFKVEKKIANLHSMEKAKFFVFIADRKHVICQIKIHVLTWIESPVPLRVLCPNLIFDVRIDPRGTLASY